VAVGLAATEGEGEGVLVGVDEGEGLAVGSLLCPGVGVGLEALCSPFGGKFGMTELLEPDDPPLHPATKTLTTIQIDVAKMSVALGFL
jgi:hypothetical protein